MPCNQEEIYKNILFLSQEMRSTTDLPHVMISLDHQKKDKLIFLVIFVAVSSENTPSFYSIFSKQNTPVKFVHEHAYPVKFLKMHPIVANVFRLHVPTLPKLIQSNGILDFYKARKEVSTLLRNAFGEFRDWNGGLILKLEEQLSSLKTHFGCGLRHKHEIIEQFFYSLIPIEKQATLPFPLLKQLYLSFFSSLSVDLSAKNYFLHRKNLKGNVIISIRLPLSSSVQTFIADYKKILSKDSLSIAESQVEIQEGFSFTLLFDNSNKKEINEFVNSIKKALIAWDQIEKNKRVIRIGMNAAPSLDPRKATDEQSSGFLRMIFEGLTRFSQDGKVENGIAKSIEISPDQTVYTFKLRHSFWNDGSPLTAQDFVYSWKKNLLPDFHNPFVYFFYPIHNAKAIKQGQLGIEKLGVHAIDEGTLLVKLQHPLPYFLELLTHPLFSPIQNDIDSKWPNWTNQVENYRCNGPFKIETNLSNYGFKLVKNPYYWDSSDCFYNQIVFLQLDAFSGRERFRKNEIDFLGYPFWSGYLQSEKIMDEEKTLLSEKSTIHCLFNTDRFPFNYYKFRKALSLAIDFVALSREISPYAENANSLLPPHLSQCLESSATKFQPLFAKSLFNQFLIDNKINKKDIPTIKIIYSSNTIGYKIASFLAKSWTKAFEIPFQEIEEHWNVLYQKYTINDYQVGIMRWISKFDDPMYTLNAFKYSKTSNLTNWNNLTYAYYLDQADNSTGYSERNRWVKKAELLLLDEVPMLPLFHIPFECLKKPQINFSLLARCGFRNP